MKGFIIVTYFFMDLWKSTSDVLPPSRNVIDSQ
jgi:hypothetical protein